MTRIKKSLLAIGIVVVLLLLLLIYAGYSSSSYSFSNDSVRRLGSFNITLNLIDRYSLNTHPCPNISIDRVETAEGKLIFDASSADSYLDPNLLTGTSEQKRQQVTEYLATATGVISKSYYDVYRQWDDRIVFH